MAEFDSLGIYRELGVEGGAKAAREDVVGALLRFVRAEIAVSLPLPASLSEEKECKIPVGKQSNRICITKMASYSDNSLFKKQHLKE